MPSVSRRTGHQRHVRPGEGDHDPGVRLAHPGTGEGVSRYLGVALEAHDLLVSGRALPRSLTLKLTWLKPVIEGMSVPVRWRAGAGRRRLRPAPAFSSTRPTVTTARASVEGKAAAWTRERWSTPPCAPASSPSSARSPFPYQGRPTQPPMRRRPRAPRLRHHVLRGVGGGAGRQRHGRIRRPAGADSRVRADARGVLDSGRNSERPPPHPGRALQLPAAVWGPRSTP